MPNGSTSTPTTPTPPSKPNFEAAYAEQNSCPTIPAVEEIVTTCPERCFRISGRTARVTFNGPRRFVVNRASNCSGDSFLKETAKEVARVVDQHINARETAEKLPELPLLPTRGS